MVHERSRPRGALSTRDQHSKNSLYLRAGRASGWCGPARSRGLYSTQVKAAVALQRGTVTALETLRALLGPDQPPATVAIEACREAWYVHDLLTSWGNKALLVDTTRCKQLGVGQHGRKTDRIDAQVLALAVERGGIPIAHVLSPHRRELHRPRQPGTPRQLPPTTGATAGCRPCSVDTSSTSRCPRTSASSNASGDMWATHGCVSFCGAVSAVGAGPSRRVATSSASSRFR